MTPQEIAEEIVREHGAWMISQVGEEGLGDMIWDLHEPYQYMTNNERAALHRAVAKELFG